MSFRKPVWALLLPAKEASICFRCARRIAKVVERNGRLSHQGRQVRQIDAAKSHDVDRSFFWAHASRKGRNDGSAVQEYGDGGVLGSKAQIQDLVENIPITTLHDAIADLPPTTEEPPHRRRKRFKKEAAASQANAPLPLDASSRLSRSAAAAPAKSWRRIFSAYLALTKPRLAFLVVLTTTASYSMYPAPAFLSTITTDVPTLSALTLLYLTSGTFLAIASANTLNMLFEPAHDARMSRTKNRPIVRGLVSKRSALLFASATGLLGAIVLWEGINPTTAILGASNIVIYAFVYTPLKRMHPINTWVGAIVGGIPPLMGWCAAGSQYSTTNACLSNPESIWEEVKELLFTEQAAGGWLLAALLFAWQFPHFFALAHGVRHEYTGAGYKMLSSLNIPMAARVSLRYSLAMFPICAGLCYCRITEPSFLVTSSIINGWMAKEAFRNWKYTCERGSARALFWASVWQLPIVLLLAMVQKRGLLERLWRGIVGKTETGELWEYDEA